MEYTLKIRHGNEHTYHDEVTLKCFGNNSMAQGPQQQYVSAYNAVEYMENFIEGFSNLEILHYYFSQRTANLNPADIIIRQAESRNCDAIVFPTIQVMGVITLDLELWVSRIQEEKHNHLLLSSEDLGTYKNGFKVVAFEDIDPEVRARLKKRIELRELLEKQKLEKEREELIRVNNIKKDREGKSLCVNCGGPLGFSDKLFRRKSHKKCNHFKE